MNHVEVIEKIIDIGIVPVVRASSAQKACMAAEAVAAAGIPVVEITMTVPGALEVIASLRRDMGPHVVVGAGTVLGSTMARQCLDAGAQFLVSPGFDAVTVQWARAAGIPIMAGALTPTEIITAWNTGADFVKVFPCSAVGGANYIKAIRGPLPEVPLVPTGGVNLNTAADFIKAGAVALGIGGELVSPAALDRGDAAAITAVGKEYLKIVQQARGAAQQALTGKAS